MRIASLVPSATEMLFELGLGSDVVAVTHECDWPPEASTRPQLTRSLIPEGLEAGAIERLVRERLERGESIYELDRDRLAELEPDLIVTQAVCEVCAVSYDEVVAFANSAPSHPRVISLDPERLDDVFSNIAELAEATGTEGTAQVVIDRARTTISNLREAVAGAPRPRVLALEWLGPPYVAGHWVPEMIEIAGGEPALGAPGERSRVANWSELRAARCDVALVMPCGYDIARSIEEAQKFADMTGFLGAKRIVAVDASAYFSRPGPRVVDGIELLANILHPDRVEPPLQAIGMAQAL
jgi:iron complex transport system substrate-binding protein